MRSRYFLAGLVLGVIVGGAGVFGVHQYRRALANRPADPTIPIPSTPGVHAAILERHKLEPVGVVFLGDSITEWWDRVPWIWDNAFGRFRPSNDGIAGEQTGQLLWRIGHGEFDGIRPRVVVLLIGTNNLSIGRDDGGLTAIGVGRVVGEIRRRLPDSKILLLGLLPRHDQFAPEIARCNAILATFAGGNVTYFDPGPQLVTDDFADDVHLAPGGYKHLADLLSPRVTELYQ